MFASCGYSTTVFVLNICHRSYYLTLDSTITVVGFSGDINWKHGKICVFGWACLLVLPPGGPVIVWAINQRYNVT